MDPRPIGVFDSGVGGLTVARALRTVLPGESLVYLGDTARLPYGTKSAETVARYAISATRCLVERDVKLVVVACNTASAVALDVLRRRLAPLPVLGVVEPGAAAACAASRNGRILVLGTEGTIRGGAYDRAILARRPGARVVARACPLFVALAEEGWIDGAVPQAVARTYLQPLLGAGGLAERPDTVVLGCTHFPVLRSVLQRMWDPSIQWVDSARTTASEVAAVLAADGATAPEGERATVTLLATDDRERFARVGQVFFGDEVFAESVDLVDL